MSQRAPTLGTVWIFSSALVTADEFRGEWQMLVGDIQLCVEEIPNPGAGFGGRGFGEAALAPIVFAHSREIHAVEAGDGFGRNARGGSGIGSIEAI